MSGLAEILLNLGYEVSGSDLKASTITRRLESLGLTFHEGHAAGNLGDAGIVTIKQLVEEHDDQVYQLTRIPRKYIKELKQKAREIMRLNKQAGE